MPAAPDFDPVAVGRRLLRQARTAALATLARRTGHPFGSMVTVACEPDGTPVILLSGLAAHSRNLAEDPRASLLFEDRTGGDPQQAARITVVGAVEPVDGEAEPIARRRYLTRNPDAALYAGFGDFAFHRLVVEDAHLVAGFGRAVRIRREDLLLDAAAVAPLLHAEPGLLAHLGENTARLARLAARLTPAVAGAGWSAVGLDPEGLDLATTADENRAFRRLVLPRFATSEKDFETLLAEWEESGSMQ